MNIYTLTLNPAYDLHAFCESFAAGHENLAQPLSREAGGKGVNISRALRNAQIPNTAIVVLGNDNCAEFKHAPFSAGLNYIPLEQEGRIRENLTLHSRDGMETRISFAGFSVDASILTQMAGHINADENTIITFTGRVPAGLSMEEVKAFLEELRHKGAKLVLDSKSFSLQDIYALKPWLIKPNQEEITAYLGRNIRSASEAAEAASEIGTQGVCNVMVSLGEQGAVLYTGSKCYAAKAPVVHAVSTIGAGDSAIAGFIAATAQGMPTPDCLRTAVAYGSAACLTEGSQPPRKADTDRLFCEIEIMEVP